MFIIFIFQNRQSHERADGNRRQHRDSRQKGDDIARPRIGSIHLCVESHQ